MDYGVCNSSSIGRFYSSTGTFYSVLLCSCVQNTHDNGQIPHVQTEPQGVNQMWIWEGRIYLLFHDSQQKEPKHSLRVLGTSKWSMDYKN